MEEVDSSGWQSRLEQIIKGLTRDQWADALNDYDKLHPIGADIWTKTNPDAGLGDRLNLHGWRDNRVNYTGDARVFLASRAFEGLRTYGRTRDVIRTIALYYPFLRVIPLASVGLTGPLVELADPGVRRPVLAALNSTLSQHTGRRAVGQSFLPDTRERLQAASATRRLQRVRIAKTS